MNAPSQLHVHEDEITATAHPIAARQKLEKIFTVSHAAPDAKIEAAIHQLVVQTPGVTFVSFDAAATAPMIKISAEFPETLDAFQVVPLGDDGLEIHVVRSLARQYLLTEVVLPTANTLLSLDVTGSGTVVVQDNVLAAHDPLADLRIKVVGSGDLVVTTHTAMTVRSLSLDLCGSGDVQVVAPSITAAETFRTQLASSGDVRVFTSYIAASHVTLSGTGSGDVQLAALSVEVSEQLSVSVGGSGNIAILGDELKANVVDISITGSGEIKVVAMSALPANKVDASVAGSGRIRVASTHARCENATLTVTGSGSIDARDLVARQVSVRIAGSGSALFRASQVADTHVSGSGSAKIVGELPPSVTGNPTVKTAAEAPSEVERLGAKRRAAVPEPTRADAFEKLTGLTGTYNVTSFSEFITGLKAIWNGTGNKVIIRGGNARSEP